VPAAGKPWITANQVTLARLIPMPLLAWLIYRGAELHKENYLWGALIAGTLIGCTDWVDGMLARRYGPTVLGGLLDPIADKVFIAFAYVPFADATGPIYLLVPWWACALMFTREFFITALRSAYEQRNLSLKTSYIAKAKTWTQMQGIGVLLLFPLLGDKRILLWIFAIGAVIPIIVLIVWWIVKRSFWRGALVMTGSFVAMFAIFAYDERWGPKAMIVGIVGITWFSGLDYLVAGWKQLRGRGDFRRADGVRLLGSFTLPILVFAVLVETDAPRWCVFTILAFELAVGGLDNLLSHHKVATLALAWGGRVLGVSILLAGALLIKDQAAALTIVATAVSVIGVTAEFVRGRAYYIDHLME
jgi:CDP-diacylglycerol--glycerol-3-phosphate 3-phosphatidyltransferase